MKTCLIYGQNGLDLDVVYNLESLYRRLGFHVFFSVKLHEADLLVVTRAIDKPAGISDYHYSAVHIFDYTGWDYDLFIKSVGFSRTFIFTTDEARRLRLPHDTGFPEKQIFLALPPVDTSLWSKKLKKIKFRLVHIGNYKVDGNDYIKERFVHALRSFSVQVWGDGWGMTDLKHRGKAPLLRVSRIYSESGYALGLMYPFQRNTAFSGRFWHAPLNGCSLLSEKGIYTDKIPGIIETDYTEDDIKKKISKPADRKMIQSEAIRFWDDQFTNTLKYIERSLEEFHENRRVVSKYTAFIFNRLRNLLFRFYQRTGLSALNRKK